MGLYDRDYTQADFESQYHHSPRMRAVFPRLTPVVKWLIIINIAVFLPGYLIPRLGIFQREWFSVFPETLGKTIQLWRYVTYQFLHGSLGHIFWNMLVLFFFGPMLEQLWGPRKFLVFYLVCGAAGGIFYPLLVYLHWLDIAPLIGASGSILGLLAAAAILFPHMIVLMFGVFPIKMSILAIIIAAMSILSILRPDASPNAGGEAAHLGGMVAGAVYILSEKWRYRFLSKVREGGILRKKTTGYVDLQIEVDRILEKVHQHGIHSLTYKEKKILKQATKAEQMRNTINKY